jgi:Family of unknown function (DUF6338)
MPELPKGELFELLVALLPGFVAAWVFHGMTAHRKANAFERVIHALIITAFIFPTVTGIRMFAVWIGSKMDHPWRWSQDLSLPLTSLVVGILYGLLFTCLANTSWMHSFFSWMKLTKRTSFPSEWYSVLIHRRFVYLQLKDGRRIYGWPTEFPDYCDSGHFALERAEWIVQSPTNPNTYDRAPLAATNLILIPAKEVMFVETEVRWNYDVWGDETEPYSANDLANSVQIISSLGKSEESEDDEGEPEAGEIGGAVEGGSGQDPPDVPERECPQGEGRD